MTSSRPYREALSHEFAVAELRKVSGSQLDPRCVDAFLASFDQQAAAAA
jgi:HD-GYP domain-containing protein (c-di-GMP phosphodiesterase class II)